MNKNLIFIMLSVVSSCSIYNNDEKLELEIMNSGLNYLNVKPENYSDYRKDNIIDGAKTIITYKLTNNSDKTFYFNVDKYNTFLDNNCIKIDQGYIKILDNSGNLVSSRNRDASKLVDQKHAYLDYLDYDHLHSYGKKNFIIHPNETLYFEWFVILPFGNTLEDTYSSINIDSQKEYSSEVILHSDSVNYKKNISRTDLKIIKENNYEVYNGTITSKNKVPIIFNNPK